MWLTTYLFHVRSYLHVPSVTSFRIEILLPSSRFHLMDGVGLPDARHLSVTLEPSRTITSLDVKESSMLGGTTSNRKKKYLWIFRLNLMNSTKNERIMEFGNGKESQEENK